MKKLSKGILSLSVIALMGVVTFSLTNTKKELKVKDLDSSKLAVFVKQEDGSYKTVNQIPSIGYLLNTDKSTCSNGAKPTWSNNALNLSNLTSSNTNCYLYFDTEASREMLNKLGLSANTTTPDFSQVATTDEGIFATEDGMYGGTSYYWRGAATTNYVRFAGYCWRAIRINGDGSLRLIYDGSTCHQNGESTTDSIAVSNVVYNTNYNRSEYVGYTYTEGQQRGTTTESNIKITNDSWFNTYLGLYSNKVAQGKYCNDRNTANSSTWSSQPSGTFYYAGYMRIYTDYTPTLNCPSSDIYTLKAGLISADETMYAGGKNANNTSYYLYSGQSYWTMSPRYWESNNSHAYVFAVTSNGYLDNNHVNITAYSLRPVINLRSDVTFTGNGTIDNPFVVEGAE